MSHYQDAIEFREAFQFTDKHSHGAFELQQKLITEEFIEVIEACAALKQEDCYENAEALLKELADLVFVCYQMAALEGWDLDEAMKRVFTSNMSKLGPDGTPVRRADGKILKGSGYRPPILTDLVEESND
jgi:predicted HAD superfamily Cof-like phosphohydrolase